MKCINAYINGSWRNTQYEAEFTGAVMHILLNLHTRHPIRTLTLSANALRCIPWVGWHWPNYKWSLTSLIITEPISGQEFMTMYGNYDPPPSLIYLDMTGVVFGLDFNFKIDLIFHLSRIAPSLAYLRLCVNTAVLENLHLSQWLFDGALGSGVISETLPSTIKMVLFQEERYPDSKRTGYHSFVKDLINLEERDHRIKMLDWWERELSLYQLVEQLG
ncbi:hypothetical protein FIBSPDRAFT_862464 [Athelia psychrophila]|uniref:Uncharacterized protein n=1 Tax=Athelia psychrophila TaxID=1759441 RepID=A0A166IFJ0_9AGAM|nr:hypothetical protein FIBSPDRAFT_862464 [Fibularhizoctonia sp. CBS 109695]